MRRGRTWLRGGFVMSSLTRRSGAHGVRPLLSAHIVVPAVPAAVLAGILACVLAGILAGGVPVIGAGPAMAGPNEGGTFILHDANLVYSVDSPSPCGVNPLTDCASADARIDGTGLSKVWK